VSVGVASNKFLAKIASDMNKPDGLTIVPRTAAGILAFLAPLPAGRLWGVGKMTLAQLQRAGIYTIGDLQARSVEDLAVCVGRHQAAHLWRLAYGEDSREIELEREEKSLSREVTFSSDCRQRVRVTQALAALAEEVGEQLRAAGKYAGTAHLKVRWHSFKTITRQRPFETPCCDGASLREAALALWAAVPMEAPVRLIGFGVRRLSERPARQQQLLFAREAEAPVRRENVSRAVDAIRDQFGEASIRRAADLDSATSPDADAGD
jgi:DNA polymerase-4